MSVLSQFLRVYNYYLIGSLGQIQSVLIKCVSTLLLQKRHHQLQNYAIPMFLL